MAKGVINLQKESGGVTKITSTDGTGITELVLPESGELVNKDYADLKVALAEFIGANQNLTTNGYQKLPGGLIIQWCAATSTSSGTSVTFPIAFPNTCLKAYVTCSNGTSPVTTSAGTVSKTGTTVYSPTSATVSILTIGY